MGKHLLVKTAGVQRGDGRRAGSNPFEQTAVALPSRSRGRDKILISQMGLGDKSKAVSTRGVRITDEDDGKELGAESRAYYRSCTMRASYLSQDRCELQSAVKELASSRMP